MAAPSPVTAVSCRFVRLHRKLSAVYVLWSSPASVDVSVCVCVSWVVCVDPGLWPFVFEEGSPASQS